MATTEMRPYPNEDGQRGPTLMTESEYCAGNNDYAGICLSCGEIQPDGVEPDAEGYRCEGCDARAVMGFEMALVAGHIEFKEEE